MRIISGQFKSRRFTAPKNLPVRPTTDRAKESLFNILNNNYYFHDLKVLDLFAGIGSISFEFLSRGTKDITAVDNHKACIDFINQTAETLGENITTVYSDVLRFLEQNSSVYDLVFADPPYAWAQEELFGLINLVLENQLSEEGIFILEHSKHVDLSTHPKYIEERKYGLSVFSWFEL